MTCLKILSVMLGAVRGNSKSGQPYAIAWKKLVFRITLKSLVRLNSHKEFGFLLSMATRMV